jgi:deferrochelatase/peroxidase EfeB
MSEIVLSLPMPRLDNPFQPGVTDPVWPEQPPQGVNPDKYEKDYAGTLARQRHLHLVTADIAAHSRKDLYDVFRALDYFAHHQMTRAPAIKDHRPYDAPVEEKRVSVTVGLGATLFTTRQGDDRFGLVPVKPTWLNIIPSLKGDAPGFVPREYASDLLILLASDDFYVNEYLFGLLYYGNVHRLLRVRRVERGYARPDSREPGGFEDGSSNPRDLGPKSEMHGFVYVREGDDEPKWCVDGTYLAYRKIQRRLAKFFHLAPDEQERVMGAQRNTGERIVAPSCSHKIKMNPKRVQPDVLGIKDDDRQMLRRPYFYNDGLDASGEECRGVHHMSFVRNLQLQYEWRVLMWQMNENFPSKGEGSDTLYKPEGGASNVGGGYYFIPGAEGGRIRWPL